MSYYGILEATNDLLNKYYLELLGAKWWQFRKKQRLLDTIILTLMFIHLEREE